MMQVALGFVDPVSWITCRIFTRLGSSPACLILSPYSFALCETTTILHIVLPFSLDWLLFINTLKASRNHSRNHNMTPDNLFPTDLKNR